MLRATSEIAVAISVRSVLEKPSWDDRRRPSWRAVTMSASEEIGTWTSSAATAALHRDPVEEGQALLEIEGGVHPFQVQAELYHRESHLGLDAHHHRLGPAQVRHVRDPAQRSRGERVHHVERGHVDDDPARAHRPRALQQLVPQPQHLGVAQRRLDGGDQVAALLEYRHRHWSVLPALANLRGFLLALRDLVSQQPLGLLDSALEVAYRRHLAEVHTDSDKRLRDLRREARDDHAGAHQPGRLDRLDQVVRDGRVDCRDAGDVDDDDLGAVGPDAAQQLLGDLPRALRVEHADDRQDEQALAHLKDRCRELADGLLLLADDALALLHEAHAHRVRDPV